MKIDIAQINVHIGNFSGNLARIRSAVAEAKKQGADLTLPKKAQRAVRVLGKGHRQVLVLVLAPRLSGPSTPLSSAMEVLSAALSLRPALRWAVST